MTSFLIFLAILAAIVFWAIGIYNRLINERNRVKNAFAQIDVQLTRRYDLIPNLVEAVKGYMKHERETLEAVISARNAASSSLMPPSRILLTHRRSRSWVLRKARSPVPSVGYLPCQKLILI